MDSPWRLAQYSPSSACEIAPPIALDSNVCCPCPLGDLLLLARLSPFSPSLISEISDLQAKAQK